MSSKNGVVISLGGFLYYRKILLLESVLWLVS
jgi:hypothetical protein